MKIMRGKEEINGLRLPKEWSSKSMRIIRSEEEVNGLGSLGNKLVNSIGWHGRNDGQ